MPDTEDKMPHDPHKQGPRIVRMIIERVAAHYGFELEELRDLSVTRRDVARARHVAMYLCREDTEASFNEIARAFGFTSHTTIVHGVKTIQRLLEECPGSELAESVRELRNDQ